MLSFSEEVQIEETMKVEVDLAEGHSERLKVIVSNMTRRAERVLKEATSVVNKSDDPKYIEQVQDAVKDVKTSE